MSKKMNLFKKLSVLVLVLTFFAFIPTKVQAEEAIVPTPHNLQVTVEDGYTTVSFEMEETEYQNDIYYHIQCDKDGNWEDPEYDYYTYSTSYSFWNLDMGEKYSFRVCALLDYYDGQWLDEPMTSEWTPTVKKIIAHDPIVLTSVQSAGAEKIKISWEMSWDGDGYRVYRSTNPDSGFKLVKTIKDPYTTTWTNTNRIPGERCYYKVCTYTSDYTYNNGQFSEIKSDYSRPLRKSLTAKSAGIHSITLSWKNTESRVDGYEIYRSNEKNGEFKRIKTITDKNKLTFTNTNRTFAKYYYYKMRAFCNVNGEKVYGKFSDVKSARAMVKAPELQKVKLAGITKAKLTWDKVPNASGYQVYRATSSNGTYKRIKTIEGNKTFTHTAGSLVNGNTYYFKVRAYRTVDGTKYYGDYSVVRKRIMNKLGYEYESYESKSNRIFGTDYYKEYKSASAASKNMKTIQVKTWDINSNGKKYTRYHYLTVHKNIAETVQQIFKEIYNGKEKFPIKSVGGYSWRGDSSASEHCEGLAIDINPNENAQFSGDTGKPLVGSLYKPGKNPYSIPADGDVVKTFRKYGFGWGDRFYNPDYMHFSYFGR